MSSKSAIACNRRAWETTQMAKLIMITLYSTRAYLPIMRERANSPGGRCAGPSRWPLRKEGHVGLGGRPLWELPRAEESRLLSAGPLLHFRPPRRSREASTAIASEPSFFPSLFHSAAYPSLAWSAGYSPLNLPWVNIWLRVCCPGILTWALTSLLPSCIILRISPIR